MKSKKKIRKKTEVKEKAKNENVIIVVKKKKRIPVAKKPPKVEPGKKAYIRQREKLKNLNDE
jgi:hypothetical protein